MAAGPQDRRDQVIAGEVPVEADDAVGEQVRAAAHQAGQQRLLPGLGPTADCAEHGAAEQARIAARALPSLPVWAIDADGIIVRPGPRLVTGVEALAAVLHPGAAEPAPPGTIQRVG